MTGKEQTMAAYLDEEASYDYAGEGETMSGAEQGGEAEYGMELYRKQQAEKTQDHRVAFGSVKKDLNKLFGRNECRNGMSCDRENCSFFHDGKTRIPCKFGKTCRDPVKCIYTHGEKPVC
jgi:hypothetical protein